MYATEKSPDLSYSALSQIISSKTPSKPVNINLSLHARQVAYYKKREEIFNKPSASSTAVPKIRFEAKFKKELHRSIETTSLDESSDDRVFLQVKLGDEHLKGLVDSGANVSCIGRGGVEFVERNGLKITKIDASVKTAGGSKKLIVGYIKIPIHFRKLSKEFTLFIVPDLQQELYLGTDFIRFFQLAPDLFPPAVISEISLDHNKHNLTDTQQHLLKEAIACFPSCETLGLGKTHLEVHTIDTKDYPPIKSRYYPVSPAIQSLIDFEVDRMLSLGIIEPSSSPWASPVTLVRKPNKNRLCIDFRKVNSVTVKLAYPIPNIDGLLSRLSNTRYISAIDLKDAFWQIPLDSQSREKTAFVVPGRPLYQFTSMPFGLCNAPQRMCMLMDKVIPHELKESVFVYLDDLLIVSPDFSSHFETLKIVAKRLRDAGLTINMSKSNFCFRQVNYLGYIVGEGCLKTDPSKTSAIVSFPIPKTKRQVRGFLGLAGWYRRFIPNFASLASPLSDTLKGEKFSFTEEALNSFQNLKEVLSNPPVLTQPDFTKTFHLQCDASNTGIGAVLFQVDENSNEKPLYYYSSKLTTSERNYSVTERECLAVVKAVTKFRPYIEGYEFNIITDHHSLKWLMSTKDLSGRLARWSLKLQGYTFVIQHRKGSLNIVPDCLSRQYSIDSLALEELSSDIVCHFTVDFDHPSFKSQEYSDLAEYVKDNLDKLPDVQISDGFIFKRTHHSTGNDCLDAKIWKLWVPSGLRDDLISRAHDPPNKSHGGIAKTISRLRERFYWPYLALDVKNFIKLCEKCQTCKSPNVVMKPPLHGCFQVERPFQHLFVDFLGPYPRTKRGNTKMIIVLDQLTKFILLEPIRSSQSFNTILFLKERVFNIFSTPETILSDNGTEFTSKNFKTFLETSGVKLLPTAKYSPQGNSSERVNRSIIESIRCYIKEHSDWDEYISDIACALRSAIHQTIQTTPYEALFGHPMVQHGQDYELLRKLQALNQADLEVLSKSDHLQIIQKSLMKKINAAHESSTRSYNLRTRSIAFVVDQEVYCRTFPQSNLSKNFVAKFSPKFRKARILQVLGKNRYELGDLSGKRLGVYHSKDIKPG